MIKQASSRISRSASNKSQSSQGSGRLPDYLRSALINRRKSKPELSSAIQLPIILRQSFQPTCQLCETLRNPTEMSSIGNCSHLFCDQCLHQYSTYKLNVMEAVVCPKEGCPDTLKLESQCFVNLPDDYKRRYHRFLLWQQTIANPRLRMCPSENCEGLIDSSQPVLKCKGCGVEYCADCMLRRHQGPCDANFQANFKDWKRCPSCSMFIQKTEGCNHMVCRCNHQFCYVCLSSWNEDHYQCGDPDGLPQFRNHRNFFFWEAETIQRLNPCLKILLHVLMVLLFPILCILGLGLILIAGCLGLGICCLATPCALYSNGLFQRCLPAILVLPVMMVLGGIGGFFMIIFQGFAIGCELLRYYCRAMGLIWGEPPEEEEELLDDLFD